MSDTTTAPGIGDRVRIYQRSITNVRTPDGRIEVERWRSPGATGDYTIVRQNRHSDWTVRDAQFGCTHDVLREDVVHYV